MLQTGDRTKSGFAVGLRCFANMVLDVKGIRYGVVRTSFYNRTLESGLGILSLFRFSSSITVAVEVQVYADVSVLQISFIACS